MLEADIKDACAKAYELGWTIRRLGDAREYIKQDKKRAEWISFMKRTNEAYRRVVINAHYAGRWCRR